MIVTTIVIIVATVAKIKTKMVKIMKATTKGIITFLELIMTIEILTIIATKLLTIIIMIMMIIMVTKVIIKIFTLVLIPILSIVINLTNLNILIMGVNEIMIKRGVILISVIALLKCWEISKNFDSCN